jgi:archaellum component FlaG (FlaF/FlaG flagellin family)
MVVVVVIDPEYSDETVVNCAGTCTRTVPVCPGKDGRATVEVAAAEPTYSEVTVVNSPVTDALSDGT